MKTPPVIEALVEQCVPLAAAGERGQILQLVGDLLADADALAAQVPPFEPGEVATSPLGWTLGGEHIAHRSDELTVMVLDTLPGVRQPAHDHRMTAFIGVFEGCEEQRFWARTSTGIKPAVGRRLEPGNTIVLGERAIHAISSPEGRPARALHVYLGDIYGVERSLYDPDTGAEHAYSAALYDQFCRSA